MVWYLEDTIQIKLPAETLPDLPFNVEVRLASQVCSRFKALELHFNWFDIERRPVRFFSKRLNTAVISLNQSTILLVGVPCDPGVYSLIFTLIGKNPQVKSVDLSHQTFEVAVTVKPTGTPLVLSSSADNEIRKWVFSFNDLKVLARKSGFHQNRKIKSGLLYADYAGSRVISHVVLESGQRLSDLWCFETKPIQLDRLLELDDTRPAPDRLVSAELSKAYWLTGEAFEKFHALKDPSLGFITLSNVHLVVGVKGYFLFNNNNVLKESAGIPCESPAFYLKDVINIGTGFWAGGRTKHDNIFHFLYDDLARASFFVRENIASCKVYFPSYSLSYCKEILREVMGNNYSTLEYGRTYFFEKLYMCNSSVSTLASPCFYMNKGYIDSLRNRLIPHSKQLVCAKRIYVGRGDAQKRRIKNFPVVEGFVKEQGFDVLSMSDYTPFEQIFIFSNAAVIIAEHGAGLTNMIFCSLQCKLIELFSPFQATVDYYLVAMGLGLSYVPVVGNPVSGSRREWVLSPDSLSKALKKLSA